MSLSTLTANPAADPPGVTIVSPLTGQPNVTRIGVIRTKPLIQRWKRELGINIQGELQAIDRDRKMAVPRDTPGLLYAHPCRGQRSDVPAAGVDPVVLQPVAVGA